MLEIATLISYGLGLYLGIGCLFALWFVTKGVSAEPLEGLAVILRLMLLPGAILLWPFLWIRKSSP